MWRSVHSVIGLGLSILVMVLALTGSVLATKPVYDRVVSGAAQPDVSVAEMLRQVAVANPDIEATRLVRNAEGQLKLSFIANNRGQDRIVDPGTGTFLPETKTPPLYTFVQDLHRSFLWDHAGRGIAALGGIAMAVLCLSGVALLIRRLGGWRQLFAPMQGRGIGGLHAIWGRVFLIPLVIIAITAVWMFGATFNIIPSGGDKAPAYPESLEERTPVDPWDLHGLQDIVINEVSEIVFPIPEDWFDVWAVKTNSAYIFIDQFSGDVISRDPVPTSARIYEFIYVLHTAEGSVAWAVVLFVSSLSVPFFAVTGVMIWWRNRRTGRGRITGNASVGAAKAVILVGSEGGSTWEFAKALHKGMDQAGMPTRVDAMNALRPHYPKAETLVCMAATYGDGVAPKSASRFMVRLGKLSTPNLQHVTLGFGDKAFPAFCGFATETEAALTAHLGAPLIATMHIDKQSAQTFHHWSQTFAQAIGTPLDVSYEPVRPKTRQLHLTARHVFGEAINATIAVLRFDCKTMPRHRPGDLIEIYPPGCAVPRLYSLGSCSKADGFVEICVRRIKGGLCSDWLCGLQVGATIDASVVRNDRFQLPQRRPVVMIGAGTGIAPFTGMIRQNAKGRPMDLFWGGRHPEADGLYGDDIHTWLGDARLHTFAPAWSRENPAAYVQDKLRDARPHLIARLKDGATIMVCGGKAMASAVHTEIDILAAEVGSSAKELKRRNRYLEDVY